MRTTAACPELTQYRKLASGHLSPPEKEAVLDHLERCQACVQRVASLSEKDTLVDLIRQARTLGEGPPGETVARLVERLRKLRPSAEAEPKSPAQIRLGCSGCGKTLKAKGSLAGKKIKCPHCQAVIPVPNTPEPPGEESLRSSAPGAADAVTLAPTGPVSGGSSGGTGSDHGAGLSPPASKELCDFLAPAQSPDELGRLGPYRVLKVLGAGGMGVVFQAEDPHLQRLVALKAMLPGLAASDSAKQRFLREARAAAALKHDHVVTIHQVGEDRGAPYLAMEFLEGEPLDDRLKREGKLPRADVLRIGREMAEGLAAAHERGLIHRDIKPANVWLEGKKGRVKILDFGLARAATDEAHLTQPGAVVGTPAYMAPEQGQGKTVDPRCDLFSLGCVLYRMATGAAPFGGTDMISTLMAVATETPRPPQTLEPRLPRALSDLIVNLLAKEPADRPASAQAVIEKLDAIGRELAQPVGVKPRKRWPAVAAAAAFLTLLAAGIVFFMQTPDGTVRIEIDDPEVKLAIEGHTATITNADKQPITLKPGKHGLTITRGDFTFDTASFELPRRGNTVLKVTWHSGQKLVVMQDGTAIGEKARSPVETASVPLPPHYKNSLGMEFVLVPKGKSWLGGGGGTPGDREVEIHEDFYLGKYEVTQGEWQIVMGANPSDFKNVPGVEPEEQQRFPVEQVSWLDAQEFIKLVNEKAKEPGWVYRLPTDVEWEYACRGGPPSNRLQSAFDFYFGEPTNNLQPQQANFGKSLNRPCKVGSYRPNRLGLHDMHGNVWEWCDDEQKDDKEGSRRVLRGGSWSLPSGWCRAANRSANASSYRRNALGLRLARVPVGKEPVGPPPSVEKKAEAPLPRPAAALEAMRRDQIPPEALATAGAGDPNKAPASLVGVLGQAEQTHTAPIFSVAFSPDGRWLASGSEDNTVLLRDVATGRVQRTFRGHTGLVSVVAFSKDSRTLVSGSRDGTLKLWPLDKEAAPETLQPKLGEIWGMMAVSADGRFLAAGGSNGRLNLWKWGQWVAPAEITPEGRKGWIATHPRAALAFSPDGEMLAVARVEDKSDVPIRIYATTDGKQRRTLSSDGETGPLTSISFSRDGKHLICHLANKVGVWEVASWKRIADVPVNLWNSLAFAALSPDGKTLAVIGANRVLLHDLASQTLKRVLSVGSGTCCLAFSADGKLLAVGGRTFGVVHVWDTTSWKERNLERGHLQQVQALAVSPDGNTVLSAGNDDTLRRWDLSRPGTNQVIHRFEAEYVYPGPHGALSLAYSQDGKMFALLVRGNNVWRHHDDTTMRAWDATTLKNLWTVPLFLDSVAFSPDGKTLAGGANQDSVRLWDAGSGSELHRFSGTGRCFGVAFSGDGKLLAAASWDKNCVKVWNVESGAEAHSWQDTSMTTVAFRRDGQVLATGHKDGTISVWDVAEGKKKRTFHGHGAQVQSLQFTPDGKTLVSSGHDGVIRLWNPDFERAREVIPLGPANQRLAMDLDRSGKYLLAAGNGPLIYVLRIAWGGDQAPAEKKGP